MVCSGGGSDHATFPDRRERIIRALVHNGTIVPDAKIEVSRAKSERGEFEDAQFFDRSGRLVASAAQEGVRRPIST